jgi:hypothetical protein
MSEKHILFVEDDEGQRDLFNDAINDWNSTHGPKSFIASYATNTEKAKQSSQF